MTKFATALFIGTSLIAIAACVALAIAATLDPTLMHLVRTGA